MIVDDHEDVRKEAEKTLISISKLLSVTDVTQHALLYFAYKENTHKQIVANCCAQLGSHVLAIVLGLAHSQDDEDHRVSAIG